MFNFTTTNVINSLTDLSTGLDLIKLGDNKVTIKRIGTFNKANVVDEKIYLTKGTEAELASAKINFTDDLCESKKTYRINMYIGLSTSSNDSRYSNDLIYKGKPFTVEYVGTGTISTTLDKLLKTINKYQVLVFGEKQLEVTKSESTLTFTAKTEFLRFKALAIEKYNDDTTVSQNYPFTGAWETVADLDDTNVISLTQGKEGFGTYSYLLRNLRLPTSMRTRAFGVNQDETPVVGALYNEYVIHYCADRGPLGTNAVGDQVKSVTTHVFWVNSALDNAFATAMKTIGTLVDHDGKEVATGE